jgi:valyl-tRNA synthetase
VKALPAEDAPVAMTGAAKVMLHVEIDRDAERTRLAKEIERLAVEMEKARNNLGNEAFVAKAPPAVVDQMKKRLADFESKHADLRTQLAKLG